MKPISGIACYVIDGAGWASAAVTFTPPSGSAAGGESVLLVVQGREVACGPGDVERAIQAVVPGVVSGVRLYVGPATTDEELAWIASAGYRPTRLTLEEIMQQAGWWYDAAHAHHRRASPLPFGRPATRREQPP
jgi:hypothetical protein